MEKNKKLKDIRKCMKFSISKEHDLILRFIPNDKLIKSLSLSEKIFQGGNEYIDINDDMVFIMTKHHFIVEHKIHSAWFYIDEFGKSHMKHDMEYYDKFETYSLDDILNVY